MKKISIIMMALVLVMGMSQCKKNEQQANNGGDDVVLSVNFTNDSKLHFGEENFAGRVPYFWNAQDVVYVATNGVCAGYIFATGVYEQGVGSNFNGTNETINLDLLQEGAKLDFFTLGGQVQSVTPGATDMIFSYENQSEDPAVLNWGTSQQNWTRPNANYTCTLLRNYNTLVVFTLNRSTADEITIQDVNTEVKVNFNGTFENRNTVGNILTFNQTYGGTSNIRYATVPMNQEAISGNVLVGGSVVGTFDIPGNAGRDRLIKGTITLN